MQKNVQRRVYVFLVLVITFVLTSCAHNEIETNSPVKQEGQQEVKKEEKLNTEKNQTHIINADEQEFNNSGRAKAIEDETDLWQYFETEAARFGLKFPHDVSRHEPEDEQSDLVLNIGIEAVEGLEGTMGYDEVTARKNLDLLSKREYGKEVDFPFPLSKKVKNLGSVNAQDFMVFGRFEICDARFERVLYFINNGYQVVINLSAKADKVIAENMGYFRTDKKNCGDEMIWDLDKWEEFYSTLPESSEDSLTRRWFEVFDDIVDTIEFYNKTSDKITEKIMGKWISLDDEKSSIEFDQEEKVEIYDGEELSRLKYEWKELKSGRQFAVKDEGEMMLYEVVKLEDDYLELTYLPRGTTLRYRRAIFSL